MVAMAGIVSAAVIVDEDFSYADGLAAGATMTGTGLTGTFTETWGNANFSGGAIQQVGEAKVSVSNPITDDIGSGTEFWVSYRYQQNGWAWPAAAGAGLGFGSQTYRGAFFKLAEDGTQGDGPDWQTAVPQVQLGDWIYKSTNDVLFTTDVTTDSDLFIIGKVVLSATPHISMAVYDWDSKPTSEASIVWNIDVDYGGANLGQVSEDYTILAMSGSGHAAGGVKFDDVLQGDTATDIGVIPEPATLGLVATFAGMALFIRRRLMM